MYHLQTARLLTSRLHWRFQHKDRLLLFLVSVEQTMTMRTNHRRILPGRYLSSQIESLDEAFLDDRPVILAA